jgi:hypothetical protein
VVVRAAEAFPPQPAALPFNRSSAASAIATCSAAGSSPDKMEKAVDPYDADQDEIDRDDIVQQAWHEQNQPPTRARNGST